MKIELIAAAILLAVPALADSVDCNRNDLPQQVMNRCAYDDYQRSDRALNEAYNALMAAVDPGYREKLRAAQRNWIQFRDTQCKFETADNEGGTLHPLVYAGCLRRLTDARTRQLVALLNCRRNDKSCAM